MFRRLLGAALVLATWVGTPAQADTVADGINAGHTLVVVTFANDPYRPAARAGSTGRRYTGGTYGVAQGAHNSAQQVANAYSLKQVASWPIKQLNVHCVVYEIPDSRPVSEVLASLAKDKRITLAQPLQQFHTLTSDPQPMPAAPSPPAAAPAYNDPLYGLQSNLATLGISSAHEYAQGEGVKVALIDTGVDNKHPDLRDRITAVHSYVDNNSPTPAGPPSYRHGTAMAGLIAAVANNKVGIVGIAPLAQVEVFAACWQLKPNVDAAACNTFTLAQALSAALDSRAQIINLSIAGPADPLLTALVQSGLKRGVIFVGSTADDANSFPTNIGGVIGVANADGAPHQATLLAPGSHVLTLLPSGEYDFESGTSVAAAEVTGAVALLLSANSRLGTDAIVSLLKTGASGVEGQTTAMDVNAALSRAEAEKGTGRLARSTR